MFRVEIDAEEEHGDETEVTGRGDVSYVSARRFDHDDVPSSWPRRHDDATSRQRIGINAIVFSRDLIERSLREAHVKSLHILFM